MSCMLCSFATQCSMRVMNGAAAGEPTIAWLLTVWSSSSSCASSTDEPFRMKLPVCMDVREREIYRETSSTFSVNNSLLPALQASSKARQAKWA
eukprot:365830-Chlamydomonas_euryale.AAC.12